MVAKAATPLVVNNLTAYTCRASKFSSVRVQGFVFEISHRMCGLALDSHREFEDAVLVVTFHWDTVTLSMSVGVGIGVPEADAGNRSRCT